MPLLLFNNRFPLMYGYQFFQIIICVLVLSDISIESVIFLVINYQLRVCMTAWFFQKAATQIEKQNRM
jgi:hypothetical protein